MFMTHAFMAYRFSTPPSRKAPTRKYDHQSELEKKIDQTVRSFEKTHGYRPELILVGPLICRGNTLVRENEIYLSLRQEQTTEDVQQTTAYDPRLPRSERKK
jgi:hypothetical protein